LPEPLNSIWRTPLISNRLLALSSVILYALAVSAHAQTQQQVAFIGDNFIADWCIQPEFIGHSNWKCYATEQGQPIPGPGGAVHGSGAALAALKKIVQSGQKPVIFFEAGEEDLAGVAPSNPDSFIMATFATNVIQIIKTAQAAKLPLIIATIPYAYVGDRQPLNDWLMMYAARANVSVVNFDWAMNHPPALSVEGPPQDITYFCGCGEGLGNPTVNIPYDILTVAGYDLVTDMADTQIGLTEGAFHLIGGYLGTIAQQADLYVIPGSYMGAVAGLNTVTDGSAIQFMAYGKYSDGTTRSIRNADINGHIGTWTTSSPNVIWIQQNGLASAMEIGSSNIHFTTLSGVTINEWTMYVDEPYGIKF
jgi:hypothetical protein